MKNLPLPRPGTVHIVLCASLLFVLALAAGNAADVVQNKGTPAPSPGHDDTPMLPNSPWRVHDSKRPHPRIVTPGISSTQHEPGTAPSDAIVLFDGTDLSKWKACKKGGGPALWNVENGYMEAAPKTGTIETEEHFGDCQLHIEWAAPAPAKGESQSRGNSGVFLMGRYEVQILDSYDNVTYADGQAASIYGQAPPLVNACRKPGEWQTYDIVFEGPVFNADKLVKPAYLTLFHNGVLVHNHAEVLGLTTHKKLATYRPHPPQGPVRLQDHGNPVRFRSIWIRPLTADQPDAHDKGPQD